MGFLEMRARYLSLPLLMLLAAEARAGDAARSLACRTSENATRCFWTTGRLWRVNGTQAVRLMSRTSSRVLGIYSIVSGQKDEAHSADYQPPRLPESLAPFSMETGVNGNFEVCPLGSADSGKLQAACISQAQDLTGMRESRATPLRAWPTLDPEAAEWELERTHGFWGIVIGIDGTPTPAVVGYRSLLKAPDGRERFHRLMRTAGIAGQLYALCGLYMLEPRAFEVELKRVWDAEPRSTVEVGLYDGSTEESVRDLLGSRIPDGGSLYEGVEDIASGTRCRALATDPLPPR